MTADRPAILGGNPVIPGGPPPWPTFEASVNEAVAAALADGSWGRYLGPHCDRLRESLAELHGAKHVHLCSSGTAAIEIALRGLSVGPGDEVILAAYDFEANFKNVLALGATPLLIDVRSDDAQIDLDRFEEAASEKVRAVLVSHLHGGVVDMPRLRAIGDRRGWAVLEDACQMPGAIVGGRRAGTWGDAGVLSFGGSKLLTAGRGGCIVTDRDDVIQRVRLHVQRGNDLSPLSEVQAVALLPQVERLDARRRTRIEGAEELRGMLEDIEGLTMFPQAEFEPDYYKVALWYDNGPFGGLSRDAFAAAVRAEGAALWPGFRGLHLIHSRRRFRSPAELSNAGVADQRLLVLHHPVLLGGSEAVGQVAAAIRKVAAFAGPIRDAVVPVA